MIHSTSTSIADVPHDVMLLILKLLDFYELLMISQVSRRFERLSKDDSIWKRWYDSHFIKSSRRINRNPSRSHIENLVRVYPSKRYWYTPSIHEFGNSDFKYKDAYMSGKLINSDTNY